MLTQITAFVSDHANQAILLAGLYLVADDVLVLAADIKKRTWAAVIHSPRTTFQLLAEDVSTRVAVAIAGAGMVVFFAGGANPKQAALDAVAAGLVASAAVVLNDVRVRFAAFFAPQPAATAGVVTR